MPDSRQDDEATFQRDAELLADEDVVQNHDDDAAHLFTSDAEDDTSMDVEHAPADAMVAMIDCLQTLGVRPEHANRYAASIIRKHQIPPTTFYEAYGTGNIQRMAAANLRNLNVTGLAALDLRTCRPDGHPWDVRKRSHRRDAYRMVREDNPDWIVGRPPCTPWFAR